MSAELSESLTAAAVASHQAGDFARAGSLCARAIEADPRNARALHFLGLLKNQTGDHAGAEPLVRQAIALDPSKAPYHATLGNILHDMARGEEAVEFLSAAARRFPDAPWVLHNLGRSLLALRRTQEALPYLLRSVELNPSAHGLDSLGKVWRDLGDIPRAIACLEEALRLNPRHTPALTSLAGILRNNRGDVEGAVALYRRAMAAEPHWAGHHSNLLLALHYRSRWTPEEVFREHLAYAAVHADLPASFVHAPRPAGGRLRIGYLSGDFRDHVVVRFFESLARHHDHGGFEIFCYSDAEFPDAVTDRLRGYADHWRDTARLSNAQTAALVHQDRIDILVDLSGHTGKPRLKVFARKPAPVQAAYLGYPDTTGLSAVDYRIVDAVTDPPGMTERHHSEELVRLPGCFLAYTPPADAPPAAPLPCLSAGRVTFGSFNNSAKISREWVGWVARILAQVQGSRCLIKSTFFRENDGAKEVFLAWFAKEGIGADRLILRPADAGMEAHLARYGEVDVALDTHPYCGTTTTCEALWMGVPVVTLAGSTHVSRVGASLMTAVGLPGFVAKTPEDFIRIAVEKAGDAAGLAGLRAAMRERMAPLTDGAALAAKLEAAYHAMWRAKAPK